MKNMFTSLSLANHHMLLLSNSALLLLSFVPITQFKFPSRLAVRVWSYGRIHHSTLDVWNRWFTNEIKSPCLEIQVDIRESWQTQAKEKLEMLLLFGLNLQIGVTWRHSQINSGILQLSKLIGS